MPRKKSDLSVYTRNRKRMKLRSQESEEERQVRLNTLRLRQTNAYASETADEQETKLESRPTMMAALCPAESDEVCEAQLPANKEHQALSYESETFTPREVQLTADNDPFEVSMTFTQQDDARPFDTRTRNKDQELESNSQRRLTAGLCSEDSESVTTAEKEYQALSYESDTFTPREVQLTADNDSFEVSMTFTQQDDARPFDTRTRNKDQELESNSQRRLAAGLCSEDSESVTTAEKEYQALSYESDTFTPREVQLTADNDSFEVSMTFTQQDDARPFDTRTRNKDQELESNSQRRLAAGLCSEDSESVTTAEKEYQALSCESETFTQSEMRLTASRESLAELNSSTSMTYTQQDDVRSFEPDIDQGDYRILSPESETFTQHLTADRESLPESQVSITNTQHNERHVIARSLENDEQSWQQIQVAQENNDHNPEAQSSHFSFDRQDMDETIYSETQEVRIARLENDLYGFSQMEGESQENSVNIELQVWRNKERSGFNYEKSLQYSEFSNIGAMAHTCAHCQACKWQKESVGFCCSAGKVQLDILQQPPPEPLNSLLIGQLPLSKQFLKSIRSYNSAFQMTSFGAKEIREEGFMPTFRIQGQVYHAIGSLLPNSDPKFLQIYFVADYTEQAHIRGQIFPSLNPNVITDLQTMLHSINSYVRSFKAAIESVPENQSLNYKFVISADRRPDNEHLGRYNAPSTNEVAVVLVDQECDRRDIVIRARDDSLQRISETHRAYDALQYPLIYCHGEDGYHFGLRQVNPSTGLIQINKKLTALQFYCYLMQIRRNRFTYLQRFRGLFSQFIVDMYAKIETERLVYIRTHQRQLRAENYVDLRDAVRQDTNTENMGRLVILPSSFTGSPRNMHEQVQDALSYVRKYGKPDLFITMTTNPKWTEITQELLPGQVPFDRHDLISRVFHLKLKLLINLITKEKVFGTFLCFTYNVEWQKRGLPHAHILLWLQEKIRPQDVDNVISAEIPSLHIDPELHAIIKAHMIHGPCGTLNMNSPCMREGRCTKKYPRSLLEHTITGEDGYPKYRRRSPDQGGHTANLRLFGQEFEVDNRWVVPYSPVLSRTFEGHINAELCSSIKSIKYVFKYVNKGSDQATLATSNDGDEIKRFQTGRYISSSEAAWRIFSFPIYERSPTVMHLDVHVEGGQRVYFDQNNLMERLENPRQTTLIAFFQLCESDNFAKTLLYDEVPSYYTYDRQHGIFNRRRRGHEVEGFPSVFKEHAIGRVYTVHPNNTECFYARLLLHTVRGPTSFACLKTFEGIEYPSFQAACRARGLLEDDQHWDNALYEACVGDNPQKLRHLFAIMLVFCGLSDANQLWMKYQNYLAEDFLNHSNDPNPNDITRSDDLNRCLCDIQVIVTSIGGHTLTYYGLPELAARGVTTDQEHTAEVGYNIGDLTVALQEGIPIMTQEQATVFDRICQSVMNASGGIFFLDAPGGTGKTFITKLILAQVRTQGKIALAMASSGIAATLLPGGKTAHAMMKIPIELELCETPVCDISRNSEKAKLLCDTALIVWDECTMAHRKAVEAVNRTLQDIRKNNILMGGVTVLFSGDFRQTLPVVTRGTRADEIKACLKSSVLWPHVTRLHLTTNMRAQRGANANAQVFSEQLLKVGEDRLPKIEGKIVLSNNLCKTVANLGELISSVYGDPAEIVNRENSWLCERAILTPRNDQVASINATLMERVEGQFVTYTSIDRVVDQEEATAYPIEFLNSLAASGLPAHEIKLKLGVPIILMRNISPPKLCNGTRLKVIALQRNVIEAEILTGCGAGERVFIPRIPIIPNNYPFRFKRIQLPVSVAFAMTINKAQGQTLHRAGVDLTSGCFSHGQLYVALSRVSSADDVFVFAPQNMTYNIVYEEALR